VIEVEKVYVLRILSGILNFSSCISGFIGSLKNVSNKLTQGETSEKRSDA